MESVFITGATGFIGQHIALFLAEKGHCVHVLHRTSSDISGLNHPNIKLFIGDVTNSTSIEQAMKGCTGVFHIAAYAKQWGKDKDKFHKINYEGTLNVLNVAKKQNIQKAVFTSTAGVIGPSTSKELVDENTIRTVDFFFDYEKTKWMAEEKIQEFVKNGMDISIVSPTRVYGPGLLSESNGVTTMINQYYLGKWHMLPGNGKKIGNYVFVDDVVKGHYLAYTKGGAGERYILGGTNISYIDFFKNLNAVINSKYYLIKVPAFVIRIVAAINMLICYTTGKAPFITPSSARKFLFDWNVSSHKATKHLSYNPISLSEGLQKTINWLKES